MILQWLTFPDCVSHNTWFFRPIMSVFFPEETATEETCPRQYHSLPTLTEPRNCPLPIVGFYESAGIQWGVTVATKYVYHYFTILCFFRIGSCLLGEWISFTKGWGMSEVKLRLPTPNWRFQQARPLIHTHACTHAHTHTLICQFHNYDTAEYYNDPVSSTCPIWIAKLTVLSTRERHSCPWVRQAEVHQQ